MLDWAFDGLLAIGLLWLAWQALASRDLFRSIVFFVAFGLVMALTWVRLGAPDVALAEAAIGAGLTGALLMSALAALGGTVEDAPAEGARRRAALLKGGLAALAALALAAVLGAVVWTLAQAQASHGLGEQVGARLGDSGVSNPVTAVLLNFRGYDTLLEMAVLLLAVFGMRALIDQPPGPEPATGPVLDALGRVLAPFAILVAGYLLWVGSHAPGGAFQAGSVLGAAGVLLILSGWRPRQPFERASLRLGLVVGLGVFVAIAALALPAGGRLLEYPLGQAGILILLVEAAATVSIALILAGLFLGIPSERGGER